MRSVFLLLILSVILSQKVCEIENPVHCGFDGMFVRRGFQWLGITEQMCIDRGCCYKEGSNPTCFYPNLGMGNITKVHVVHGCHFDAGFVDTTVNIVNRYFDEIYPRVYNVHLLDLFDNIIGCYCIWKGRWKRTNALYNSSLTSFSFLWLSSWFRYSLPFRSIRFFVFRVIVIGEYS